MTKILERAYEKAKALSANRQDEVGEILLSLVEQDAIDLHLSPEQQDEVRRRLANPTPLVPEHEMKALFRKFAG
ncbi:MAG: hypothetical protein H7X89_03640 [Rhizobiales bacterium]|nr:hypothetical protein [Hyphomicrobiales bacterium]